MGGAEKIVYDSIPLFAEKGFQVSLLLLNGRNTPFLEKLKKKNCCDIYSIKMRNIYNPFIIFKIIPFLKNAQIVHVHLFPSLYWVAIAKLFSASKAAFLYTEHSTVNRRRKILIFKYLDRFVYPWYHSIITVSNEVKQYLENHLKSKSIQYKTITNGVDLPVFNQAYPANKAEFGILNNEKVLLMVARFTNEKDHETLIKAVPHLKHSIKLLLVGNGPLLPKMKQWASNLKVEEQVVFLGIRQDVPELLKMADIAVLSSHHEGLSLWGIEAMAAGKPLVASKVSGLTMLVADAGILFEHTDYLDLAKKLNLLLENESYYKTTALACFNRAQEYSLENLVKNHISFYEQVCINQN